MCNLYTSRPSLLFSVESKGIAFQVSSIVFSSYTFLQSLVRGYIEVKINKRDLVSFDPANFEMSKVYQENFQSLCRLTQFFLDTSASHFTEKERNRCRKFFPALKMQFG